MTSERERLAAVRHLGLLDRPPEERFEAIVRLCHLVFDVPMAAVNLIDEHRQFTVAQFGLRYADMPRRISMCDLTVASDHAFVVPDMLEDARFREHPAVTSVKKVRFYAGMPLRSEGKTVGSLCLLDDRPRELATSDLAVLRQLADLVEREFSAEEELSRALELQQRLLPSLTVDVPGLDIAGRCSPSRDLGGDFYDWQRIGDTVQVLVADVMGKGLSAALIAASVRAVARSTSVLNPLDMSVDRLAGSLASDLRETDRFVTLFAARIDPATGNLQYVDAGHGLACLVADGEVRWLRGDDLPIGAGAAGSWRLARAHLAPGAVLLLLSDGMLDVHLDEAALAASVAAAVAGTQDAASLADRLVSEAVDLGSADDVTALAVRRGGPSAG